MEHQRLRYVIGYCAAILTIAVAWFRTGTIPEVQETAGSTSLVRGEEELQEQESGDVMSVISEPEYRSLYPDMYVRQKSEETSAKVLDEEVRTMYLTFDDGPSEVTKEVVETLDAAGVKATFFLIGNQIQEGQEELIREMAEAGHVIGIHTYSHDYKKIYESVESYLEDFHKTYERIYAVTGVAPEYFRFPWGSINCYNKEIREELIEELERRGFQYFDWNVSAEDSVGKPTEYSVLHNVVDSFPRFRNAVVLMHDSSTNQISAKMLPQILESAKEKGYQFGTIDQLEKPYHWPIS